MKLGKTLYLSALLLTGVLALIEANLVTEYTLVVGESLGVLDTPKGNVFIWLYDAEGNLKGYWNIHNNLTIPGRDNFIREVLGNQSLSPAKWIAIGTGNDTDGDPHNNSALVAELTRKQAVYWEFSGGYGLNATFTFSESYTILEAGVLNAASGGILVFYVNDLLIGVNNGDSLEICWKITISGN